MKKAITTVHTIIVILGLLATAGWSGYYLYNQRQFNTEANAGRLPALVQSISGSFNNSETLYDKSFGDDIKKIFTENKDIIALSIYSYDTGIEYFYSRNGQVKIVNEESESLEQNPSYKGLSFANSIGSVPLQLKDRPGSNVDIIFTVLPRTSVFYVLKIALLAVIVLFVITLILIVAFSLSKEKAPKQKTEEEWNDETETSDQFSDPLSDDLNSAAPDSGFDDDFGTDSFEDDSFSDTDDSDFSLSDDLDFDLPADENTADSESDFSLDDSDLGLDSLDLPEDSMSSDLDLSDLESDFQDDMNLEDSIPDIPDEEDLLGMDHEELPADDFEDDSDDSVDDFSFPEDESLFDELSSDDLDLDDSASDETEPYSPPSDNAPSLYNPETGLGWEAFLDERLGLELERSASFDQDLVLLMIRDMNDESDMEQISAIVREEYSYHDLIFEAGKNSLALIEPNKDLDDAISDAQNLIKKLEKDSGFTNLKCGLSSRNGRLITGKRLIKEADTSLNKADEENPIVGFRSDPEKFREFLSNNS